MQLAQAEKDNEASPKSAVENDNKNNKEINEKKREKLWEEGGQ